jgi:predicted transposase YbfD/YdcC
MEPLQSTLLAYPGQVPDFRHARGSRFAWSYLLALVTAAIAAGQTSILAMVSWAHEHAAELVFREPPIPVRPGELLTSQTHEKGHGRLETRSLISTTALNEYLTWPGLAQIMRRTCRRINTRTGRRETEVTYGLSSLPRSLAGASQLEHIWRGHWTIENRLHSVRDETFGEDRCQLRTGAAPQALAAIRNAVLSLLRFHGWTNIAAATRCYAQHPQRALQLLGVPAL